jgi:hypothetical protein
MNTGHARIATSVASATFFNQNRIFVAPQV